MSLSSSKFATALRGYIAHCSVVRWAISQEPLVWIERNGVGANVPARSLAVQPLWHEDEEKTVFAEQYTDSDGVVVKQSCHIRLKQGLSVEGGQGVMG